MPDMPPPIGRYPATAAAAARRRDESDADVEPDTSYCCAVDRWGNAFSATPSDGSWRSPVVPGLGIVPSRPRLAIAARSRAIPPAWRRASGRG